MTPIKPILIVLVLLVSLFSLRSKSVTRLTALSFVAAAVLAILHPELTSHAAHALGVGRGADLLLYLFSLSAAYGLLLLYVRTRHLERVLTELARTYALEHARTPAEETPVTRLSAESR